MSEMAADLQVDPAMMSTYVNQRRRMPRHIKEMVSAYLGMPEDVLFNLDEREYFRFVGDRT